MEHKSFDINNDSPKKIYCFIFVLSFLLGMTLFLPYIIADKGYFYFLGDYNCQQIPFNMLAHSAVKNGDILWNWNTDLGASFIGSYAFYLLGSPFFWLSLLLPNSLVPMAVPWMLCLKFAVASMTAYGYLSRFVKNKNYALFAALMYSFSGFSVYNIFFNHFNDVIALFPLLLIGLEELMEKDRKGVFAAAVFINALCNYYFFVAEVVFIYIYWCFRMYHRAWPSFNLKKFGMLIFEAVIGFGLASFIVLPAVLTTMQISRSSTKLSGWGLITYFEVHRYPQLLEAFFFPPEIPSQPNLYPDSGGKWSSVAAWLPLFSMTGVLAWIKKPEKDWIGKIVITLCFMAFIPPLNALFQLLSNNFYTRWFFMLVMMLALATEKALEESSEKDLRSGLFRTTVISAALILPVGLVTNPDTKKMGLVPYPERLWAFVIIITLCLFSVYVLLFKIKRESVRFNGAALLILCLVIIGYGNFYIFTGRLSGIGNAVDYTNKNVLGRKNISLPDSKNIRIDVKDGEENAGMFWGIPTIQAFHSIVPGSIMDFYETIGVTRDVASRPELTHMGIRSLLSVKYLFDGSRSSDIGYSGWEKIGEQNGFYVWENKNYIPYGFTYDKYVTRKELESYDKSAREYIILKAIVLENKDESKYSNLLQKLDKDIYPDTSESALEEDSAARRETTCTNFKRDKKGFSADIYLKQDNLVFFSVPYEPGWSVTVNGQKAEVIKANVGFMAVKCKAGQNSIRFNYMTPGLIPGLATAGVCLILLVLYIWWLPRVLAKRRPKNVPLTDGSNEETISADETQIINEIPAESSEESEPNQDEFKSE